MSKIVLYLVLSTRFIYNESKYQLLIKKCKDAGVKYSNDLKAFIEYSNTGSCLW